MKRPTELVIRAGSKVQLDSYTKIVMETMRETIAAYSSKEVRMVARNSLLYGEFPAAATSFATPSAKPPISFMEMKADIDRAMELFNAIPMPPDVRVNDMMCKGTGKQRMELAPQGIGPGHVYVSDKCRAETNAWMRERFGCENTIYKVDKTIFGRETIFMCQGDYDKAMAALE